MSLRHIQTIYYDHRVLLCLFGMFFFLNLVLYLTAERNLDTSISTISPVVSNAADGQRYWGVAKSLVSSGSFSVSEDSYTPLRRAGPLTGLLFAQAIFVFGTDAAPKAIVFVQCLFLFVMGMFSRTLATPFQVNKTIVQSLVIFNPNLIGLAHSTQSDLLFSFLFTLFLVIASKTIGQGHRFKIGTFFWLGVVTGLAALTRPTGFYFIFFFPFFIFCSHVIHALGNYRFSTTEMAKRLSVTIIVALLVTSPWIARNYLQFNEFKIALGQLTMCQNNYDLLIFSKHGYNEAERKSVRKQLVRDSMQSLGYGECFNQPHCQSIQANACFRAILKEPAINIIEAYIRASTTMFFSGGVQQIVSYLSIQRPPSQQTIFYAFDNANTYFSEFYQALDQYRPYAIIFFLCVGFSIVTRIIGIIGFFRFSYRRPTAAYVAFYTLVILWFIGVHMFIGVSRFRAPLEPLLMLFAATGFSFLYSMIFKKSSGSISKPTSTTTP